MKERANHFLEANASSIPDDCEFQTAGSIRDPSMGSYGEAWASRFWRLGDKVKEVS